MIVTAEQLGAFAFHNNHAPNCPFASDCAAEDYEAWHRGYNRARDADLGDDPLGDYPGRNQ